MTAIWFLLTMVLMSVAAYAAARWGADSRDDEFTMRRVGELHRSVR